MTMMSEHNADSLPGEVARPMVRRLNAEQDRHINTARIATALERLVDVLDKDAPVIYQDYKRTLWQRLRTWFRRES